MTLWLTLRFLRLEERPSLKNFTSRAPSRLTLKLDVNLIINSEYRLLFNLNSELSRRRRVPIQPSPSQKIIEGNFRRSFFRAFLHLRSANSIYNTQLYTHTRYSLNKLANKHEVTVYLNPFLNPQTTYTCTNISSEEESKF